MKSWLLENTSLKVACTEAHMLTRLVFPLLLLTNSFSNSLSFKLAVFINALTIGLENN